MFVHLTMLYKYDLQNQYDRNNRQWNPHLHVYLKVFLPNLFLYIVIEFNILYFYLRLFLLISSNYKLLVLL